MAPHIGEQMALDLRNKRKMVCIKTRDNKEPELYQKIIAECCRMIAKDEVDYCTVEDHAVWYSKYSCGGAYQACARYYMNNNEIIITEIEHGSPFGWREGAITTYDINDPKSFMKIASKMRKIFNKNQTDRRK